MAEKLREIIARCDALARELEKPEIYSDAAAYARIAKELKELEPVAAAARDFFAALERAGEAETLFDDPAAEERERSLARAAVAVRRRFGPNALLRATSLMPGANARERNLQVGGHRA